MVLAATVAVLVVARGRPALLVGGLAFLCGGELLYQWRVISRPTYSPDDLFPPTPLVRSLDEQPRPFRVAGERSVLFPNTNVFAGVEDIRTHDAVERRDYLAFLDATCGYPYGDYFKKLRNLDSPALDFLNVRYVLTEPGGEAPGERWRLAYSGADGRVFENTGVLPRAFVPERVRFVPAAGPSRVRCPTPTPFSATPSVRSSPTGTGRPPRGFWEDRRSKSSPGSRPRSRTTPKRPTPPRSPRSFRAARPGSSSRWCRTAAGPRATRPAARLELRRANGPFLAVRVPAGSHRVRLRYLPPGFVRGPGDRGGDRRPAHRPGGCPSLEKATSYCWLSPRWW